MHAIELPTGRRPRVLVVDDDDLLRKAASRLLTPGREVVQAASADDAIAAMAAGAFDCIVSDLRMPGLSGLDLLREVRRRDLDVPVILMTGAPDVDSAAAAVEFGAFRYLQKPLDADALVAAVDRAVGYGALAAARREALDVVGKNAADAEDAAAVEREQREQRLQREQQFQQALSSLWMAFQPIVSVRTGRTAAFEALLRTDEPALRNPEHFVTAAEKLGRIHQLGRAVRAAVARAIDDAPADADIFVNLHPSDLLDPELVDPAAPLARFAHRVVLELTERAGLGAVANVAAVIAGVRALGYRVALDDLGAGYAGLSCLAALSPDVVKLDMSLVRGIDRDARRQAVVASLVQLCTSLHMRVVVEGVETRAEHDHMLTVGCDWLQGYFFARPARGFPAVVLPVAATAA